MLMRFPFWPLSCHPKSEPNSIVRVSVLPILETIQVSVVVAPGSIALSPGVDRSTMKSENVTVMTSATIMLVQSVPLKWTLDAIVHEPNIVEASNETDNVAPLEAYNKLPGSKIRVLDQYET